MIIASIDIGTNTVLMLIADVNTETGAFNVLENTYRIPRLGRNLNSGEEFPEDNIREFYKVLDEYSEIINKYKCETVLTAATNAFRRAADSQKIISDVKKRFDIQIKIVSGDEEAELSYLGAVSGYNNGKTNMVIDIGGGSTEIIFGSGNIINYKKSFPIGVVTASEKYLKFNTFDLTSFYKEITELLKKDVIYNRAPGPAIAVAGTPTTLACIHKKLTRFDESTVEGSTLNIHNIEKLINLLKGLTPGEIKEKYAGLVEGREDLILSGSYILLYIMKLYELKEVIVSTRGIRFGLLIKWLQTINWNSAK